MMKIMKMVIALISMPMLALAGEEWVNGFCWSYAISNGEAEITPGSHGTKGVVIASAAVSGADLLPSASSSSQTIPAETAETSISIPSVLGGCPVVRIGNCAFQNCTWMKTNAVIPSTVTSIGECAFENCSGLTSVSIPSSVVQIGRYAFLGCGKLSTINVAHGDANRVKGMLSGENIASLTFVEQGSSSQSFRFESASAGTQSDWYAGLKEKKELAYLVVGEEQVKISDLTGNVYYFQKTNAKLSRSPVGWTLALYGAAIGGRGIQADGDLAVELAEGSANSIAITSYTTQLSPSGGYYGAAAYGMNIYGNLLIYGVGSLTINNLCRRSDGPILDGGDPAGINIGLDGWFGGSLTVGFGTSLSIHTTGYDGIHIDNGGNVDIVGASVELTGGRGIYTADAVSVKGSIVSILSVSGHCIQCGDFEGDYMFGAFAAKIGFAVNSGNGFSLDNSVACALTSQSPCIGGKNCFFGDGFYRLATDGSTMQAALLANRSLEIDGAEIECCAPGGIVAYIQPASGSDATMTMKSGLLRNRRSMDVKSEFLLNSLWNDYYGLGAAYNSISLEEVVNPQVGLETFLGTALLDFIKSNGLKNPSGDAKYGIYGSDDVKFVMTDGTVILDASESGIHIKSGVKILGGSLKGVFDTMPVNANGQSLAMFEDTVFGAGAFSKASGGWNRSLPAYYGTQSLYTDDEGKLYFWLPESGNWNGGDSGGNGSSGGEIADYAFFGNTVITSVTIPASVKKIGTKAFKGCENLERVVFEGELDTLGQAAFQNCTSLTEVVVPKLGDNYVWSSTFEGCTGLKKVTLPEGVTSIGTSAFANCKSLTDVNIPETVKTIKSFAFFSCESLADVWLPDALKTIGEKAFKNCLALEEIDLPDVTMLGKAAFFNSGLVEVVVLGTVAKVDDYCFQKCANLKKVVLEDGVLETGASCWANDEALEEVVFSSTLKKLGGFAFFRCPSLDTLDGFSGLTSLNSIGEKAFKHCSSLTTLAMPSQVTTIPKEMCNYCSNLQTVTGTANVKSYGANAFSNCPALTSVAGLNASELATVKKGRVLAK